MIKRPRLLQNFLIDQASPAACRAALCALSPPTPHTPPHDGADATGLAATLIGLATKGYLLINLDESGHFFLQRTWRETEKLRLTPLERAVTRGLYTRRPSQLDITPANGAAFLDAARAQRLAISRTLHFTGLQHDKIFWIGAALLGIVGLAALFFAPFWLTALILAASGGFGFWRWRLALPRGRAIAGQILADIYPFLIQERASWSVDTTPPDPTPTLYDRFLPFALACDAAQPWAQRFATAHAKGFIDDAGRRWRPKWSSGFGQPIRPLTFTHTLAVDFVEAICDAMAQTAQRRIAKGTDTAHDRAALRSPRAVGPAL